MKRIGYILVLMILLIPTLALADGEDGEAPPTPEVVVIQAVEPVETPRPLPVTLSIDNKNLYDGMTKTYSQGYSPVVSGGTATIVLPLIASGDISGSTIIATPNLGAIAGSPFVFGNYQKTVALGTHIINGGPDTANSYYVRFDLALVAERENGVYPVVIVIEGRDAAGYDILQEFTTYVTITDGAGDPVPVVEPQQPVSSSNGSSGPTASKPVLVTTECVVSPNSISRGDTFDVKMMIKNVGKRTAHNVRVTIVSDDDNIILISDYSAQYLRSLPSGKEKEFAFEMQVLPMALGGLHSMSITILYERTDNVAYAEAAAFRVNVSQPVMFSFDEIKLPEKVTSGESFTLPVCAYNTGLTNIYNVKYSLDVPGLIAASAYLGNLEPQASSDKTMSVFATTIDSKTKYGVSYGTCLITYEDDSGNQMQESVDLKIEIVEPVKVTDEEKKKEEEKAEEQETLSQWWISLLFGIAIIAMLTAIIIVAKFSRMMKMR